MRNELRVLHVKFGLDQRWGGPVFALQGLAGYQSRAGLKVTVFAGVREDEDLSVASSLENDGVQVIHVGPCRGALARHPAMRGRLGTLMREVDVCHIHGIWMDIQHEAARAARQAGVPYIFRPCGMLDPWCLAQNRLMKKLYLAWRLRRDLQGAAAMHFTTEIERRLVEPLRLRPRAIVEPNGVDLTEFESLPSKGLFKARYPEIGERKIVLFLSRVHQKKGLDVLIPAFARARRNDAVLVVAGPDDRNYLTTARQMVQQEGIESSVIFTGLLRERERLEAFADATIFALPSYQENFGIAVVEALAAGVPVIISDQVNIHEAITIHQVGAVVPTQVEPLAREIASWLDDDDRRMQAGRRACQFAREQYDWKQIAARWIEHYADRIKMSAP